jgi:hypothetical protein
VVPTCDRPLEAYVLQSGVQFGVPPQICRPAYSRHAPVDSLTLRRDASHVNLSFLFKLEFKIFTMSLSVILHGFEIGQTFVVPWVSPGAGPGILATADAMGTSTWREVIRRG